MKVARLSPLRTGRLYTRKQSWYSFLLEAESIPGPVRPEGLCQGNVPITKSGIDPVNFCFVAQCLNLCATTCYPSFNGHTKFHFAGNGTHIEVKPVLTHKPPVYVAPAVRHRITAAQLLLYYDHMVPVEHNRTIQQCNICINITQASLNTYPL
jgi:hypothetical protein